MRGTKVSLAARKPPACLLRLARTFPANTINHHLQAAALITFQRKDSAFSATEQVNLRMELTEPSLLI